MLRFGILACLAGGLVFVAAGGAPAFDPPSSAGFALDNGDVNGDLDVDLSDPIYLLTHLYLGGPTPVPLALCAGEATAVANGDSNGDGALDVSDPVHTLGWLFAGGPPPVDACGEGDGAAKNLNPRVIPPNASAFGKTYGEWSAGWISWAMEIPLADNPLIDGTGALCGVGQSGKVWYLCGRVCVSDPNDPTSLSCDLVVTERSCCVPAGKAICFPIANSWCDSAGTDPPPTEQELRDCATGGQSGVLGMTMEVDGVPIRGLTPPSTTAYRVVTPYFSYDLPEGSIYGLFGFDLPAQTVMAAGDGVYVMLAPLSAGEHTIHSTAQFNGGFAIDTTYHLTVGTDCD